MALFWLLLAVALLIVESTHFAFFAVFLAAGSLIASLLAALGVDLPYQVVVFVVVSGGGILGIRPTVARAMERRRVHLPLKGVHDLAGQSALTLDEVGDQLHPGHAVLAGERWLAVTEGPPIPPGTAVVVTAVNGTTLQVHASTSAVPASQEGPSWTPD